MGEYDFIGVRIPRRAVGSLWYNLLVQAPDINAFDGTILAALGGDVVKGRATEPAVAFVRRCAYHGVETLLAKKRCGWSEEVAAGLDELLLRRTMWEMRHQHLLRKLFDEFRARQLAPPVLIKGTALAHTLYETPEERPRSDTDLLLPPGADEVVHTIFDELGFVREDIPYRVATRQASYVHSTDDGQRHIVDAHRQINNSALMSPVFSYSELAARAQPVRALGEHALAAGAVDSMLIACFHRQTHRTNPYFHDGVPYADPSRFVWLMDIHLLAQSLCADQWITLQARASEKGIAGACADGLTAAAAHLGTKLPQGAVQLLAADRGGAPDRYLRAGKLRQQWMDFRALDASDRWTFLGEMLFPPRDYIARKYPRWPTAALPLLYVKRAASGVVRQLAASFRG